MFASSTQRNSWMSSGAVMRGRANVESRADLAVQASNGRLVPEPPGHGNRIFRAKRLQQEWRGIGEMHDGFADDVFQVYFRLCNLGPWRSPSMSATFRMVPRMCR